VCISYHEQFRLLTLTSFELTSLKTIFQKNSFRLDLIFFNFHNNWKSRFVYYFIDYISMEREKRQIKAPEEYVIPKVCYPRRRKKKVKPKVLQRAQFKVIPAPMKFTCIANSFAIYGVNKNFPLITLIHFISFVSLKYD